jgi:uncharacterized membrane protein required for colicin V production
MEWFWQLQESLQKKLAASALKNFSSIDWLMLVVIFWGMVQGSRMGLGDMFGSVLRIFLVSMLTLSCYPGAAAWLNIYLPMLPVKIAEPLVFLPMSILFWILVSWCLNFVGKLFKVKTLGFLEIWGGMILGGARMVLFLSFFAQFLLLLPLESVQQTFGEGHTLTGHMIARVAPALQEFVVSPFCDSVSRKIAKSVKTIR